jgi:Lar family restriction alleviation protein
MKMPEGLKPCPFCGSSDDIMVIEIEADELYQEESVVECANCSARGPQIIGANSRQMAIKSWNYRRK